MNAREYLERLREMDREIDVLIAERNSILDDHIRLTVDPSISKVSSSGKDGPVPGIVLKMIDMEEMIDNQIGAFIDAKEEAKQIINQIEDVRYRNVLKYRYLCGMKWDGVIMKMQYERAQVFQLHLEAIITLDEKIGLNRTQICDIV